MEFAKPVKIAFGQLEHIAFIKRTLDVYKKPDITKYPIATYESDLLDFIYSLGFINILAFVCISLFPSYFRYDPFKIFNIIPIMPTKFPYSTHIIDSQEILNFNRF